MPTVLQRIYIGLFQVGIRQNEARKKTHRIGFPSLVLMICAKGIKYVHCLISEGLKVVFRTMLH